MDDNWGGSAVVCHLQCEISSVKVTDLGCTGGARALFLRCHVPAGGGKTIQIDSHCAGAEAEPQEGDDDNDGDSGGRSAAVVSWRDVASLRCDGSPACVRELADRTSVVFEVRRPRAILGRTVGSELVGRAEVAWRDVAGGRGGGATSRSSRPQWGCGRTVRDDAAPVMSVRMSVRVSETATPACRNVDAAAHRRESSGCEWSVGEEDVFGVVACVADDAFE